MANSERDGLSNCVAKQAGPGWHRDRDLLQKEYDHHGSLIAIEAAHGPSTTTLKKWWNKHGLPPVKFGGRPAEPTANGETRSEEDVRILRALKRLGDSCELVDLANEADMSPSRVEAALERLGHEGYRLESEGHAVKLHRLPMPSQNEHQLLFDGELYRFGIASDTHLNSKHCRLEELHIAYDRFASEGITDVYHPGDIVSGRGVYKGQDHEIINHTFVDQVDFAVENFPRRDGIVTKLISGNHDCEGDFGRAGADAATAVANRREDIEHCGLYEADFRLPNGSLMTMRHPMGGGSYARSYTPQKFAESFEGGDKPNAILFGHWHAYLHMFERNIHMLCCGTFEGGGNSLGKRKPLGSPAVGFLIVEMWLAEDASVVRFRPEFFPFFKGRRASQ